MEKDVIIGGNWNILNKKYEGDLIFNKSNGGILLDIYYNNPKEFLAWSNKPTEITEITGYINQKMKCMLTDCKVIKRHSTYSSRHHIVIHAKSLFFGLNNKKKSTLKFNEIRFQLSNIFQWSKLNGFENIDTDPKYWVNIAYNPKEKIEIKLDNETTIEFVPGMGSFNPDMLVEKIDISQYVSVYIKKKNPTHYEKFFDELDKVINLILLSTNINIRIRKIECIDYKHFVDIEGKKDYYRYEMINEKMEHEELTSKNNALDVMYYLFDLPEILKDNKINNWFNNYDKYRNIYNLYLLDIKNDIPNEIKFCNVMQAIELIHNLKYSKKKKFYKHIEQKFSSSQDVIDNIKENKDQSESPYIILRSRMIDLLSNDYYGIINNDIIQLADVLTDSRNYYTHYNDSKRNKCVVKENLKYAIFFLNILTSCYILSELGFSLDYIKNKHKQNFETIDRKEIVKNIIQNKR